MQLDEVQCKYFSFERWHGGIFLKIQAIITSFASTNQRKNFGRLRKSDDLAPTK